MNKKNIFSVFNIAIMCIALVFTLSGCLGARELNDLLVVTGIGIDKSETEGNTELTAQILIPSQIRRPSKEMGGGNVQAYWNIKSSASTVFDALREFTHETSFKPYLSHTQVIVIGKDAASEGLRKNMDFFIRSHETRPTTMILVSSGKASEVLDVKPELEKFPALNMAKLAKNQKLLTAHSAAVNLQDFTARMLSKTTTPIAPMVSVVEGMDSKKILHAEGVAVFKNDKMIGSLTSEETRGLLWVLGKVKSGVIEVAYPEGKAALEIIKAEGKTTPLIKGGKLYINIRIRENTALVDQDSSENLATIKGFSSLEQRQKEVIKGEIDAALKKAKAMDADIFGFGEMFHKKYRKEWKQMEDKWDEEFRNIRVKVEIESRVRNAGLIIRPVMPEKKTGKE